MATAVPPHRVRPFLEHMATSSSESSDGEDAKHFSRSGVAPARPLFVAASASSSAAADQPEATVGIMHPNRDFFDNPPEPAPNASPNHFHPGEAGEPRVSRSRSVKVRAFVVCLGFVGIEGGYIVSGGGVGVGGGGGGGGGGGCGLGAVRG